MEIKLRRLIVTRYSASISEGVIEIDFEYAKAYDVTALTDDVFAIPIPVTR